MDIFLSLIIWAVGTVVTVILWIVDAVLTIILYPFDKDRRIVHAQCFWWSDILIGMSPKWNVYVKGLENIDPKKAYVIVANHQSLADILVMYQIHAQFKWVAKESLFKVPFIGWCLSLGKHIKLLRGDFASIKKVYREAAGWLRKDMSVLFFPEGTRSDTDEMNPFQNGPFKLAVKEKKPILPIVVDGARDIIPKGSWIFSSKVEIHLTVLPPIDTSSYKPGDFEKLKDLARERIKKQL